MFVLVHRLTSTGSSGLMLCVFLISLSIPRPCTSAEQYEGDRCLFRGLSGVCRKLTDCAPARAGLKAKPPQKPHRCGFSADIPIVCCVGSAAIITQEPPISHKTLDLAFDKCKEYKEYIYKSDTPLSLLPDNSTSASVSRCGQAGQELIVGGIHARPKEFPHMAILGFGDEKEKEWMCGGTLISEHYILTAGHCLYLREHGDVRWVRVGDLNIESTDDDAQPQDFSVAETITHPDYKPPSHYNDIGLIKVNGRVKLNQYVVPACLQLGSFNHSRAFLTGWNKTPISKYSSDDMLKISLTIFTHEECNNRFASSRDRSALENGIVSETQLCAGSREAYVNDCESKVDWGSPLQIYNEEHYCMYNVVGVASAEKKCGFVGTPRVYTRVSHFVPWISSIVWP